MKRMVEPRVELARALLWASGGFFVLAVGVGGGWDRRWHTTHPFDDFWSPPHLFIYGSVLLAAATVAGATFWPGVRVAYAAPTLRLPLVRVTIPAPLVLLGGAYVVIGLAGLLDSVWHTAFGLDETSWSTPHAMLGRGILLVAWGLAACRLALARAEGHERLPWLAGLLLAWLALGTATDLLGGPLLGNPPLWALRAVFEASPVLSTDPSVQHLYRVYEAFRLDRTNPLAQPMMAFSVGLGLAVARGILGPRRGGLLLLAALAGPLFTLLLAPDQRARVLLAPPFLPAALALLAARWLGAGERWAYLVAGWVTAVFGLPFVPSPGVALLAGPFAVPGGALGRWVAERLVRCPTSRARVLGALASIGLLLPALAGLVDLSWRARVP